MALSPGDTDDCVFGETIPKTNHRYRYKKVAFPHPLPTLPMSREAAFQYMVLCMCCDLRMRVADARVATFTSRMRALALLTNSFRSAPLSVADWHRASEVVLQPRQWSEKQQEFLDHVADRICVRDAADMAGGLKRFSHITGGPGTGKTEVIIHAAYRAAESGARVLILCPTGALVHGYKESLPPTDQIVAETLHSGFSIARKVDKNTYSPPGRLRRYDLIFIDEASQIDDAIFECLIVGIRELPQKPLVVIGADYQQVAPINGGDIGRDICDLVETFELTVVHRTTDTTLLDLLSIVRCGQPSKQVLRDFVGARLLRQSMTEAVAFGLKIQQQTGKLFVWLCVTNKGVRAVNLAAISQLDVPITEEDLERDGYAIDPNVGKGQKLIVRRGLTIRLTRNLDKERGFVNGAIAVVCDVLVDYNPSEGRRSCVFTARLTTGSMILVFPVFAGRAESMHSFLPCTYGYATTIRKAQGATLDFLCLYFDAAMAPDPGYAYVGASRCRTAAGLYHFGRIRRSDWRPVGGCEDEQKFRSDYSEDSSEDYEGEEDDRRSHDGYSDCSDLCSEADQPDDPMVDADGIPIDEDGNPISLEDIPIGAGGNFDPNFVWEPEPPGAEVEGDEDYAALFTLQV